MALKTMSAESQKNTLEKEKDEKKPKKNWLKERQRGWDEEREWASERQQNGMKWPNMCMINNERYTTNLRKINASGQR